MNNNCSLVPERRLFIISNSTHYLNVLTYIETHIVAENHLIFLNKFSPNYEGFVQKLMGDSNFKRLEVLSINQKLKFPLDHFYLIFFLLKTKWLKTRFGSAYDKLFISNYLSWQQHYILKQFEFNQLILINDGTAIFKTVDLRKKSRTINFSHLNFYVNKFLGSNTVEHLHFYSPISLDVSSYDSLETFNFSATEVTKVDVLKIYFVSSDLVELNFLKFDYHIKYLNQIKEVYPDADITYFAHRGENDELLKNYEFFGKVVRDSIPFEERLKIESVLPANIISYSSSILINLPQVYPQINFNYFPLNNMSIPKDSSFQDGYKTLFNYFEKMKFENFNIFKIIKQESF